MASVFDIARFQASLKRLLKLLPSDVSDALRVGVEDQNRATLCRNLRKSANVLTKMADIFDPVQAPAGQIELFAPATIGRLIGQELTKTIKQALSTTGAFYGSGIYALYYSGNYPAYAAIAQTNCPIYVGVAHPRSRQAKTAMEQGRSLATRLTDHRKNILAANTSIRIEDFQYRYLVTESGWQGTAEEFLIWLYWPVWNREMKVCSGFGKHGDVARKELSDWDVLHGGRKWAKNQKSRRGTTSEMVAEAIDAHFQKRLRLDPAFWTKVFNRAWVKKQNPAG